MVKMHFVPIYVPLSLHAGMCSFATTFIASCCASRDVDDLLIQRAKFDLPLPMEVYCPCGVEQPGSSLGS